MTSHTLAAGSRSLADSLRPLARVLTFRASRDELLALNWRDLVVGLLFTWLVGMGRYWDNPRAEILQQLGIGSVVYVFVLTTFLFLVIWPLRPGNWSWFRLLLFVTFTSPPGLLYAIPVQNLVPGGGLDTANAINVGFLGIVSIWRVALFIFYLRRLGNLPIGEALVGTLLPILALIVVLTMLNLDHVVFNIMGGINPNTVSPNDGIYMVMIVISMAAIWLIWPTLLAYGVLVVLRNRSEATTQCVGSNADEPK